MVALAGVEWNIATGFGRVRAARLESARVVVLRFLKQSIRLVTVDGECFL